MGISERKLRQKEEVRQNILHEARRLMKEDGCGALSIRKIADAIEYSVPVVYEHFENKNALLHEFVREGFGILAQNVQEASEKHTAPATRLEAIGYAYWNFAFSNKEHYQLMFGLGIPSCEAAREVEEVSAFGSTLMSAIEAVLKQKNVSEDAFLKFHSFWSMLHGLVSINLMSHKDDKKELNQLVLKDLIAVFIKGLG